MRRGRISFTSIIGLVVVAANVISAVMVCIDAGLRMKASFEKVFKKKKMGFTPRK